jgi:predicted PurR-regulated permease PerM
LRFLTLFDRVPSRSTVSGLVLAGAALTAAVVAPQVLLALFASLLMAILLHGGADWIARWTGIGRGFALGIFTVAILAGFVGLVVVAVPVLTEQAGELWQQILRALAALRTRIVSYSWGGALLQRISMENLATFSSGGAIAEQATSAVTSTFGALGSFAIICVIGVFLAADPKTYRNGVLALIAPSGQARAKVVLDRLGHTLQGWMVAQLWSMAVVGLLTMCGLWLLGVPLAFVLGVMAALLTFIPNLGPILAAGPAVLLGFAQSPILGAYVAALYVGVQIIEGNVTTPLIQQHSGALPPALILLAQLLMADLFGLMGLAMATPLTAVGIELVRLLYVEGFLQRTRDEPYAAVRPPSSESP